MLEWIFGNCSCNWRSPKSHRVNKPNCCEECTVHTLHTKTEMVCSYDAVHLNGFYSFSEMEKFGSNMKYYEMARSTHRTVKHIVKPTESRERSWNVVETEWRNLLWCSKCAFDCTGSLNSWQKQATPIHSSNYLFGTKANVNVEKCW